MTPTLSRTFPLAVVITLFVATSVVAQPQPIDLGTLGGSTSRPAAINESNQIVGASNGLAFLWTPTTGMMALSTLTPSSATAINNLGHVAGVALFPGNMSTLSGTHPFLWTPAGGMVNIEPPNFSIGSANTVAAMNDVDQVVGTLDFFFRTARSFSWTSTGGMGFLGSLGGPNFAVDVNNSGLVVGIGYLVQRLSTFEPRHAFAWTASTGMLDLGTLGGRDSQATDVNDDGQVVGWAYTVGSVVSCPPGPCIRHAFLWTATGGMVSLGTLGGTNSEATAVNAQGWVAGQSEVTSGFHGFLWTPNDGMTDLGTLGGSVSAALDLNDQGQVVGWSEPAAAPGAERGFVWTAADGMVELPPLPGYAHSQAWFVNNSGYVVGISCIVACRSATTPRATLWVVPVGAGDTTPPTLILPATIVVDATSPAGATVTYVVSATDNLDPNPGVVCSRDSGSVFPPGTTTVSCTATDAAGNSVSGTFQVIVKGAQQQLADTISLIATFQLTKLGTSLPDKLQSASNFVAAGHASEACGVLKGFLNQVSAQTGKALTVDQATALTTRVIRIRNVIGC